MPRPRTPTNVLALKGAFDKDPQRRREAEPVPTGGIGQCPDHISRLAPIWDEIVSDAPPGVLGNCDRISLETLTRFVHEMRTDWENMATTRISQMRLLFAQFGMTPSDRSKVSVPKGKGKNVFEGM